MMYLFNEAQRALLWQGQPVELNDGEKRGRLFVVSGNTGVGKSTLVNGIREKFAATDKQLSCVNEGLFHHPLLTNMFAIPDKFAFGIQMNFLVNRYIFIMNAVMRGKNVLLERCHFDDRLFFERHVRMNYVSAEQRDAYLRLWEVVCATLPQPDAWFALEVEPAISAARITRAEETGERPREFPDDASKEAFISDIAKMYAQFFSDISGGRLYGQVITSSFYRLDSESALAKVSDVICRALISDDNPGGETL